MHCTLLSKSFSILLLKKNCAISKTNAFWHDLWNNPIEILKSHPLLARNIRRLGSDGRDYFQSLTPAACHEALTLITYIRLIVPAATSPPPPGTEIREWVLSHDRARLKYAHTTSHNPESNKHYPYDERITAMADKAMIKKSQPEMDWLLASLYSLPGVIDTVL